MGYDRDTPVRMFECRITVNEIRYSRTFRNENDVVRFLISELKHKVEKEGFTRWVPELGRNVAVEFNMTTLTYKATVYLTVGDLLFKRFRYGE